LVSKRLIGSTGQGNLVKAVLGILAHMGFLCFGIISQSTMGDDLIPMAMVHSVTNSTSRAYKQAHPSVGADQFTLHDVRYVFKTYPVVGGTSEYFWVRYRTGGGGSLVHVVANMDGEVEMVSPRASVDTWSSAWSRGGLRYDPMPPDAPDVESGVSNLWVVLERGEIADRARAAALARGTNLFGASCAPVVHACKWDAKNGQVVGDNEWQVSFWDIASLRRMPSGRRLAIECYELCVMFGSNTSSADAVVLTGISRSVWDQQNRMVSVNFNDDRGRQ
jgi:hypothetical protein